MQMIAYKQPVIKALVVGDDEKYRRQVYEDHYHLDELRLIAFFIS